mmetsp:Transcript_33307/g.50231  ORF Transcript_33307/g.50231 Transcript_33307/m.50231 type:complete len:84 (-) Transcript_33307:66-317(-)
MGTRIGHEMESSSSTSNQSFLTLARSAMEGMSGGRHGNPGGYRGLFYWGVSFVFRTVYGLFGGIYLFVRSIFVLPDAEERRDE